MTKHYPLTGLVAFLVVVGIGYLSLQPMPLALEFSSGKSGLMVSGVIRWGDEFDFEKIINTSHPLTIFLNSPGGAISSAIEMARVIRKNNIHTVVNAATSICYSACTILFLAGTRRHYLNANKFADGQYSFNDKKGLGFHEANSRSTGKKDYSGSGVGLMNGIYYELGAPKAIDLVTKAPFNKIYMVSGQTALQMGLATSLTYP